MKKQRKSRRLFRYPVADGYLMFGYLAAFFALFIAVSLFESQRLFSEEQQKNSLASSIYASMHVDRGLKDGTFFGLKGYVSLLDVPLYVEHGENGTYSVAEIVLCDDEVPEYLKGYTGHEEVVLGDVIAQELGVVKGENIWINEEEYRVGMVIPSGRSDYLNGKILLWYSALKEGWRQTIGKRTEWNIYLGTASEDSYRLLQRAKQQLMSWDTGAVLTAQSKETNEGYGKDGVTAYYYLLLYVFALLNCLVATDLWYHVRKHEITVKMCFGYSVRQIVFDIMSQSVRLCGIVAMICFCAQAIVKRMGSSLFGVKVELSMRNVAILLAYVVGTSAIGVLSMLKNIRKTAAEQLILGEDP